MNHPLLPVALLCAFVILTGCRKHAEGPPGGGMAVEVVAVEAKSEPVVESLSLVGTVEANEAVTIKAQVAGQVEEIKFEEGQRVESGGVLIKLDAGKLAATVAQKEAELRLAESNLERNRSLLEKKLISQQEFDQMRSEFDTSRAELELGRQLLKDATIIAPFSGIMGQRMVSQGQVIARDEKLTSLVDLDPVKVAFNVPERFLGRLAIGQVISIGVAAYPQQKFDGDVYFVSPEIDADTRTAVVKALVKNPEHKLKPGMFANLDLTLNVRENAVVIPEAAVITQSDGLVVMAVDKEQTVQPRRIEAGIRQAGHVEVVRGLQPGEKVIVEGHQKVRPGGKVTFAPREAAAPYLTEKDKPAVSPES